MNGDTSLRQPKPSGCTCQSNRRDHQRRRRTGTITNDDTAPTLAIDDVTHAEGNAGTTAYVYVTKTGSTGLDATVNFTTQDNTATTADNDYN